jgi:hypothetical protein
MGNLDLTATLETLNGERSRALKEVAKLDKAIAVIRGLSATTPNGHPKKKHTMSAAGRKRIAKAQKLRWAKFKKAQGENA